MPKKQNAGRWLLGFGRGLTQVVVSLALVTILVCLLIVVQGQRDEARPAGAALVLGGLAAVNGELIPDAEARLDRAIDLYKRGHVKSILLSGSGGAPLAARTYLTHRGVTDGGILMDERGLTTWEQLQSAAAMARAQGISSVLVVAGPSEMLPALKMARDLDLDAYGAPVPDANVGFISQAGDVLRGAREYLLYIFIRR